MPSSNGTTPKVTHVSIKVAGSNLNEATMDKLLEVEVDTTLYTPSMFLLRFHDDALDMVDSSTFDLGKEVIIEFPDANDTYVPVIKGEITSIEPEYTSSWTSVYAVRGYDYSHRLTRDVKSETFLQVSASDIVTRVVQAASAGKLQAQVQSSSQIYEYFIRSNETALELIHRLARRIGYEVVIAGTTLHFRKPQLSSTTITLEWGKTLRSFQPRLSGTGQVSEVTVRGWDMKQKREIVGQATSSATHPSTGYGKSGMQASSTFGTAKMLEVNTPVANQSEADALALSILNTINSGFLEAEGTCFGSPNIVAGTKLTLSNLGTKFNGTYVVTAAAHRYSPEGGYDTSFTVEGEQHRLIADLVSDSQRAAHSIDSAGFAAVIGVVTNNKDPDSLGRVKVKFPWMGDNIESGWARVATVGGGSSRGLYWLPEINDEVLVVFEQGDMNHPYVVGGLYNGTDKPPLASASDAVKDGAGVFTRVLKTKKHTITLVEDSADEKIEIKDAAGDTIIRMTSKPSPSKIEIIATGDVKVDAANVTVNGSTKVDVKAPNINVEATTTLVLKGGTVKIN